MKLISVIIPTYERNDNLTKNVLQHSIYSVLKQSYPYVELIVVIDGVSKNLKDFISKISKKESTNIRVYESGEKCGAATTRNIGIKNANGHYISFLDDDDCWICDKLEKQIEFYEKNKFSKTIVFTNTIINGKALNLKEYREQEIFEYIFKPHLYKEVLVQTSSLFMEIETAKNIMFTEKLAKHQDWDFFIKAEKEGINFRLLNIPLVVYGNDIPNNQRLGRSINYEFSLKWYLNNKNNFIKNSDNYILYFVVFDAIVNDQDLSKKQKLNLLKSLKKINAQKQYNLIFAFKYTKQIFKILLRG